MKHSSWLVNLGTYTSWFYGENELTHRETYQPTSSLYDLFPGESGEKMWHLGVFSPQTITEHQSVGDGNEDPWCDLLQSVNRVNQPWFTSYIGSGCNWGSSVSHLCRNVPLKTWEFSSFGWISWTLPIFRRFHIFHPYFSPHFSTLDTLETIHWSILGFHDLPSGNLT